jgi:hypothetical protein
MNVLANLVAHRPNLFAVIVMATAAIFLGSFFPSKRKRCDWILASALIMLPATAACWSVTVWLSRLVPLKLDQYVYCIDSIFGEPSFAIGRYFLQHPWLGVITQKAYDILPCAILATFAAYLWSQTKKDVLFFMRAIILDFILALPFYLLIPVCGPKYAFTSFPFGNPTHLVPHEILLTAAPNGIPSVHMTTALLVFLFSRRWKLGGVLGFVYLLLTILATLGSGEHYLFDLIAAIPYAALILFLARHPWIPSVMFRRTARDVATDKVHSPTSTDGWS